MISIKHTSQTGFSLVEILVAVFVVSIGLLGVARMEIMAKNSNIEAIQRTTATQLAHDIIEKMRANPKQLASYAGKTVGNSVIGTPSTQCDAASCTDTELSAWDLYQWEQSLMGTGEKSGTNNTGGLDTPRGCIAGPAAGGPGAYVVSIAWRGKTSIKTISTSNCGSGAGLYGSGDEFRRVLSLTLYISDDGV